MSGWAPRSRPRLPGVRFDAAPRAVEALPRMDVAVLVGFARSGPLHVPVAVEDPHELTSIFGEDLIVARDRRGDPIRAQLGPAARAFFRNGGRRAWIIRVAGEGAAACDLPVPGLLRYDAAAGALSPARARARSAGSWADTLSLGAALSARAARPLGGAGLPGGALAVDLAVDRPDAIAPGDLLRLSFEAAGVIALVMVSSVEPRAGAAARAAGAALWFREGGVSAGWLTAQSFPDGVPGPTWQIAGGPRRERGEVVVTLRGGGERPIPGSFLRLDRGADAQWIVARSVAQVDGGPSGAALEVRGAGLEWRSAGPGVPIAGLFADPTRILAERLSFGLHVRQDGAAALRLEELRFGPEHPRFWGTLPEDEALYRHLSERAAGAEPGGGAPVPPLWAESALPRFPLAGEGSPADAYLPVGMPLVADLLLPAARSAAPPHARDGLEALGAELFLDPALAAVPSRILVSEADFIRYRSPSPRPLRGIHAALGVEEATLIAAPDAAHRPWALEDEAAPPAAAPPPAPTPDGSFAACARVSAPELEEPGTPAPGGVIALRWPPLAAAPSGVVYVVETSRDPSFAAPEEIYRGGAEELVPPGASLAELTLRGLLPGDTWARLRVEDAAGAGSSSTPRLIRVPWPRRLIAAEPSQDPAEVAQLVHAALLRLCAARGDLFAVLSLPEHHRERAASDHAAALASALGQGEAPALSYGALYHPWLVGRDEARPELPLSAPPDGAICGAMAQRAIARGAWSIPANDPLRGVVALTPAIRREAWPDLLEARVNLIMQEPSGFVALSAETLSANPELAPARVRRLLILIRRAALRLGAAYVFEPNGPALRRAVRRRFSALLAGLHAQGALAGRSADEAFRVGIDEAPGGAREAQLVVDLAVAPASPLSFLTVRLVQSGDRSLVAEER